MLLSKLRELAPSVIRTVTPYVVGALVTILARWGIDWTPSPEALVVATGLVGAVYYALVRILETRGRQAWGWLLGLPKRPTYDATAQYDENSTSPTREVATARSDLPEGTPVVTVPANEGGEV